MADLSPAPSHVGPRDLYDLPLVGSCALHDRASRIAYVVTRLDEEKNSYRGTIKVADLESGTTAALTNGSARDQAPQWSPQGDQVFFTSDRSGSTQLWLVSAAAGDASALPVLPGNVSEFAVSPDGLRVAAVTTPLQGREAVERQGWRRITRLRYRADGPGYFDDRPQIFVIDLASGTVRQLTDGSGFVAGVAWSPDGTRLAYSGDHEADYDSLWRRELWVVAADGSDGPRKILTLATAIEAPSWSHDGKRIAFCGIEGRLGSAGSRNLRVFVVDDSGANASCWTDGEEWTCGNFVLTDVGGAGSLVPPAWLGPDSVAVLGSSRGAARVFRVRRDAKAEPLSPAQVSVLHFACRASGAIVYCASDQTTPPEIYACEPGGEPRRVTRETQAWCARVPPFQTRYHRVRNRGLEIDSWQAGSSSAASRPCVLAIHGGPHFAYGYAFVFHFITLAAAGFDVVYCNPRGSQSYGEAFAQAVEGDWAQPAFEDCMAALDAAIARGGIDGSRLGVTGGSYGGYLTLWAIAHSNRFAAAVALRPATNLQSLWGTSEVGRMLAEDFGGAPQEVPEVYRRDSPLVHAADVRTPVLIVYGGQDWRTPAEQAEQFLTALLARGAIAEGLFFPNADHNLSRTGPPRQRIAHEEAILEWLERFVRKPT